MLLVQFFDGFRIKNTLIPQPIRLLLNFFGIMRRNHFLKFKNRRIGLEVLHHLKYMKLSRSEYRFLCFHSQIIDAYVLEVFYYVFEQGSTEFAILRSILLLIGRCRIRQISDKYVLIARIICCASAMNLSDFSNSIRTTTLRSSSLKLISVELLLVLHYDETTTKKGDTIHPFHK